MCVNIQSNKVDLNYGRSAWQHNGLQIYMKNVMKEYDVEQPPVKLNAIY